MLERLTVWTSVAILALVVTGWLAVRQAHRYLSSQQHGEYDGVVLEKAVFMAITWAAFTAVGVLGYYPSLAEGRSWAMLLGVLTLALHQVLGALAWTRVEHEHPGGTGGG